MDKATLRKMAKKTRNDLPNRENSSKVITKYLLESPFYKETKDIFAYASIGSEVSTDELIQCALMDNKRVFLPKTDSSTNTMEFYRIHDLTDTVLGFAGIREPKGREKSLEKQVLMIVPGLLFDEKGARLGYGGGYYDRYLATHVKTIRKVMLAFEAQKSSEICMESYDVYMGAVITEHNIKGGTLYEKS